MVRPCWFSLVVVACLCVPGLGSPCWESSACSDLRSKGRTLDCIHHCIQSELPKLGGSGLKVDDGDDGDGDDADDEDLLLSILLALLASKGKTSDADLRAHGDKRRSYTMEHFRWGKPPGGKTARAELRAQGDRRRSYTMEHFRWGKPFGDKLPKLKGHSKGRRSYAMEHFRWGKPPGRNRRPVKALAPPDSSERSAPPLARAEWEPNVGGRQLQLQLLRRAQGGKVGTQRLRSWQEKLLVNLLRTTVVRDARRRTERRKGREGAAGGSVK